MRKYIVLVLLLSFVVLLWAQYDTCLQNDNETAKNDEKHVEEQTNDVYKEQLENLRRLTQSVGNLINKSNNDNNTDPLHLKPKTSPIYAGEYLSGDRDNTDAPGSNGRNGQKWFETLCIIGQLVIVVAAVIILSSGIGAGGMSY